MTTYDTWMSAYKGLFSYLSPDTLAAIANDLSNPDVVPMIVQAARQLAIDEGRNNMGTEEFDALMAKTA
jgi:hypothetical protein